GASAFSTVLALTEAAVWPGSTPAPYTYRSALDRLMEYEGRRCLWRMVAGAMWLALVPLLDVGGFVAGAYLAGDLHHVILVALGAVVAVGAGQVATACVCHGRLWRRLVLDQLATYEQIPRRARSQHHHPQQRLRGGVPCSPGRK